MNRAVEPGEMRILIVAENASTRLGGEAIIPYHYFRLLRGRGLDAHLIVHARTREELLVMFADDPSRRHLHFVEDQLLQKIFYGLGRMLPRRVDEATLGLANQLLTQRAQRSIIRRLRTDCCVVHQPIPVSPRFPSLIHDVDAPVIIGPLNGGMEYPSAFRSAESRFSRMAIGLGRSFTGLGNAMFPGKRRAAVVMVANGRTRDALPANLRGRIVELAENAVDTEQWQMPAVPLANAEPRFVFIGRLVDWKALDLAIESLKQIPEGHLDVIGDGAMLRTWQDVTHEAGLSSRVHFHGWLSQHECAVHLAGCCALVLPSIYECGGAVVLEAMAMSKPVIATAWGGPMDYLDASCGILVEPTSRTALVDGFAEAMRRLIDAPELGLRMGRAGRARLVNQFDWQKKIDAVLQVYASVLADRKISR